MDFVGVRSRLAPISSNVSAVKTLHLWFHFLFATEPVVLNFFTTSWIVNLECIFVRKCYFKWESPSCVRTACIQTFPGEVPPSRFTIHEVVKKFETTGSVANKKWNRKYTVLTEETLDEIGACLERPLTKSIPKLAPHVGISESSAHRGIILLKLKPYKCTHVHSLKQGDPVSWISSIFYKVR